MSVSRHRGKRNDRNGSFESEFLRTVAGSKGRTTLLWFRLTVRLTRFAVAEISLLAVATETSRFVVHACRFAVTARRSCSAIGYLTRCTGVWSIIKNIVRLIVKYRLKCINNPAVQNITFDIVRSPDILFVAGWPDVEQPLSRSVHVRPPGRQCKLRCRCASCSQTRLIARKRSFRDSLVDILNLIRPGTLQRVHSSFAH